MSAFSHGDWTGRVCFTDGGKRLVSSGADGVIRCWTPKGALQHELGGPGYTSCCATPEGVLVAGYNGGAADLFVWNVKTGKRVHHLAGHPKAAPAHRSGANTSSARFSFSGELLASGGFDDRVRLWDTATGRELGALHVKDLPWSLAFSPDDALLAVGAKKSCTLWKVASKTRLAEVKASRGAVTSVAFLPNGELVTGGGKGELTHWRVEGKKLAKVRDYVQPDGGGIEGVASSADGRWLAAASRARWMKVFDAESGKELERLRQDGRLFLDVAFAPDGKSLVASGPSPFVLLSLPGA